MYNGGKKWTLKFKQFAVWIQENSLISLALRYVEQVVGPDECMSEWMNPAAYKTPAGEYLYHVLRWSIKKPPVTHFK